MCFTKDGVKVLVFIGVWSHVQHATEASEPNILSVCYTFSQFIVSLKTSTEYVGLQSAQQLLEEEETVTC